MRSRGLWAAGENPGSLCLISVSSVLAVCHCQMSLCQCHELTTQQRTRSTLAVSHRNLEARLEPRGPSAGTDSSRCVKKRSRPKADGQIQTAARLGGTGRRQPSGILPVLACVGSTCPPACVRPCTPPAHGHNNEPRGSLHVAARQ